MVEDLATRCMQSGWPFLDVVHLTGEDVVQFAAKQRPHLLVVVGELSLTRAPLDTPLVGSIRASVDDGSDNSNALFPKDTQLKVEYYAKGSDRAFCLGGLTLPIQVHESTLGKTLKSDLIADDLLLQATKSLGKTGPIEASKQTNEWVQSMLSPYLDQFSQTPSHGSTSPMRHRSVLKLCAESLVFLPRVIALNWYRHLRQRYPVLILTHHLVSDRSHFMGIPTEDIWRRIRFLQRHYRIVSLSEAKRLLRSGIVSVPTLVLTFDDGYCDNYITLRAVAEETGVKTVMFLATRQVELHKEFDHDLAAGITGFLPLNWNQVEDWSRRGVEFGSHTRTHIDCGSRDRERLEAEIAGSGKDLEMRLHQPCRFFAFPFGKPENMSPEAMQIVSATYSTFVSSHGGENLPREGHRVQHLFRKGFYSDPWELELELQSVFDTVQKSKLTVKRMLGRLRAAPPTVKSIRLLLWTLLHACLLLLAFLPPFRRTLDETSSDR